jgi:hypothetical protein
MVPLYFSSFFVPPYSLFTPKPKAPPSTMFFLLKALLEKFATTLFLFFSVDYISCLVLLTLADGFFGLSF